MNSTFPRASAKVFFSALAVATLAGCASITAPVIYPSDKASVRLNAEADLQSCRAQADEVVGANTTPTRKTGVRVAQRGATEFVDKAVESLVVGSRQVWDRARGAGAGAMAGSLTLMALNWNEPDAVYRNYVDLCLKKRGHRVLGWR